MQFREIALIISSMNGELIKNRLFELGWTKEEFAVKLKCSIATVYNMLAGRKVSDENLYNAARVLGLDQEQLVTPDNTEVQSERIVAND